MGHCAVEVTSGQFSEYLSQGLLLCHQLAVWANHSVFVMEWIFISPSNFCVYYKDQSFHSPFHFFLSLSFFLLPFPHFPFLLSFLKLFLSSWFSLLIPFFQISQRGYFLLTILVLSIIHYLIGIHYLI